MSGYTRLHLVVDTHITPKNETEEYDISEALLAVARDKLNTAAAYKAIFKEHWALGTKPTRITMLTAATEKGGKFGHIHIHIVIAINHTGQFMLNTPGGKNVYQSVYDWFAQNLPWLTDPNSTYYRPETTPYVSVTLGDGRAENYALKDSRPQRNAANSRPPA